MTLTIECKDEAERDAIALALQNKTARAAVVIIGTLLPKSQRERQRIMNYVCDLVDERSTQ